ncbi:MAG TPA: hemolysin family protein [Coriobacteriia bacterium]
MNAYLGEIATIVVLILVQGLFVAAEIALVSARRSALQAAADRGSHGARTALRLLEDPTRLLSTISAAITLLGFTASATAAVTFEQPVTAWMRTLGLPWLSRVAGGLSVFLVTLTITYFTLVFGELAPKRLGLQRAERVAAAVAGPVDWLSIALSPLVWVLARSTDVVARLLGVRGRGGRSGVTEEEIKLLVTEQGTLLEEEKRMIREVFELGDTVVREIMVPRVDAEMLEDTSSIGEALAAFRRTGFSRAPVFHEDPDTVIGIALLKDLLDPVISGSAAEPLDGHLREPLFVPETKPILDLLSDMRTSHNHMAVVVDEHGGTAGIVTIEDIVEEVVGEIADEFDREHRYISEVGEGRWIVDGRLSAEEAREALALAVPESEEFETVAGWVLVELGHIPRAGESVRVDGATVRVLSVRRRRIARLLIVRDGAAEQETAPRG